MSSIIVVVVRQLKRKAELRWCPAGLRESLTLSMSSPVCGNPFHHQISNAYSTLCSQFMAAMFIDKQLSKSSYK